MSFGVLAETTVMERGIEWQFQLLEEGLDAGWTVRPMRLKSFPKKRTGSATETDLLKPLLTTTVEMQIVDEGATLLSRMQESPIQTFRLDIYKDQSLYYRGSIRREDFRNNRGQNLQTLSIKSYDGLSWLEGPAVQGLSGTLCEVFDQLVTPLGFSLDTVVREWGWITEDVDLPPQRHIRHEPGTHLMSLDTPTYATVLKRLLRFWQAQLWQQDGEWRISQRQSHEVGQFNSATRVSSGAIIGSESGVFSEVVIDDSKILERINDAKVEEVQLRLASRNRVISGYETDKTPFRNPDLDWPLGEPLPLHWEGDVSRRNRTPDGSDKEFVGLWASLINPADRLTQRPNASIYEGGVIINVLGGLDYGTDNSFIEGTADVMQVVLLSRDADPSEVTDVYYLNTDGTWQTTSTRIDLHTDDFIEGSMSGGYTPYELEISSDTVPIAGVIEVRFLMPNSPSGRIGSVQGHDVGQVEYQTYNNLSAIEARERFINTGYSPREPVSESYPWGSRREEVNFHTVGPGVVEYRDVNDEWHQSVLWKQQGPTSNPTMPLHELRARSRGGMEAQAIQGIDAHLGPDVDVTMSTTLVYGDFGGTVYVPLFLEEDLLRGTKRVVGYELRNDDVATQQRLIFDDE